MSKTALGGCVKNEPTPDLKSVKSNSLGFGFFIYTMKRLDEITSQGLWFLPSVCRQRNFLNFQVISSKWFIHWLQCISRPSVPKLWIQRETICAVHGFQEEIERIQRLTQSVGKCCERTWKRVVISAQTGTAMKVGRRLGTNPRMQSVKLQGRRVCTKATAWYIFAVMLNSWEQILNWCSLLSLLSCKQCTWQISSYWEPAVDNT